MTTRSVIVAFVLAALLGSFQTVASEEQFERPPDPTGDRLLRMGGFLDSHPDLRYRLLGMDRLQEGQYEHALRFFRRAGRYADKLSQGMVAEMLWNGQGQAQDRALAYAWMDVAAERGYRLLVVQREQYWAQLEEAERARALEAGQAVLAEYGDAAAQPRIATVLRRASKRMTGSRTGSTSGRSMQIWIGGAGASTDPHNHHVITAASFYEPQFWDPKQYQAWHDTMWEWSESQTGRVTVGELENPNVPAAEEPADGSD